MTLLAPTAPATGERHRSSIGRYLEEFKKADGTVFMTFVRSVLIPKRGHSVQDAA